MMGSVEANNLDESYVYLVHKNNFCCLFRKQSLI